MTAYKYPCTGRTHTDGFDSFLRKELTASRRNIRLFGEELKTTLGCQFLSLVNSGSSANLIAAMAVKEKQPNRKKVLLSAYSFPTTISAFEITGFEVELVDVQPGTFNMDPTQLKRQISQDVACLCVTHFLGFPAELSSIKRECDAFGAILVQDACETMNLDFEQNSIYSYGDIITHSFYHPHHLSSFGGGAVVCTSKEDHHLIESIIHWGRACTCHFDKSACKAPEGMNHNFWYERNGVNVEISELNACFGRFQLQTWEMQEAKRTAYYNLLYSELKDIDGVALFPNEFSISPFVFPIVAEPSKVQALTDAIQSDGVEVRSIMGGAIFKHPAYQHLAHDGLQAADKMGASSFFVGNHQTLSEEQVKHVASVVKKHCLHIL